MEPDTVVRFRPTGPPEGKLTPQDGVVTLLHLAQLHEHSATSFRYEQRRPVGPGCQGSAVTPSRIRR